MKIVVLFNKPHGVLSQFTDRQGRATLGDYVDVPGVYAAGRLDRDSEGLLILTNNNQLNHKLTDPENKVSKTYWAQVEGEASDEALDRLREGVTLSDGLTLPARVRQMTVPKNLWERSPPIRVRRKIPDQWLEITLTQGRNRQVRRMCAAVGHPVLRLIRYRVASWTIDGLDPGEMSVLQTG